MSLKSICVHPEGRTGAIGRFEAEKEGTRSDLE